jgi:hypothetical protein
LNGGFLHFNKTKEKIIMHGYAKSWLIVLLLIFLGTALSASSCDETSVGSLLDDYLGHQEDQIAIGCDCWDERDYETRDDCLDEGEVLPAQKRCMKDAYEGNKSASKAYLKCVNKLQGEYTECVDARLNCDSYNSIDDCNDDYQTGYGECAQLPESVERDLDDCWDDYYDGGSDYYG